MDAAVVRAATLTGAAMPAAPAPASAASDGAPAAAAAAAAAAVEPGGGHGQRRTLLKIVAAISRARAATTTVDLRQADVHVHLDRVTGVVSTAGTPSSSLMMGHRICRLGHDPVPGRIEKLTPVPALTDERVINVAVDLEQSAVFAVTRKRVWSWGGQQNGLLGHSSRPKTPPPDFKPGVYRDFYYEHVCHAPRVALDLGNSTGLDAKSASNLEVPWAESSAEVCGPAAAGGGATAAVMSGAAAGDNCVDEIVDVVAGMRYVAVLTSRGRLYTWGMNQWGAGHTDCWDQWSPRVPTDLLNARIVFVTLAPGAERLYGGACLAIDAEGCIWEHWCDATGRYDGTGWRRTHINNATLERLGLSPHDRATVLASV